MFNDLNNDVTPVYREKIQSNYDLVCRAWQEPDEFGISYELRTRDKRAVHFVRYDEANRKFPIVGRVRYIWDLRRECTERWTAGGHYLGTLTTCNSDLELYAVFRFAGVPIPEGVTLGRLTFKREPTLYIPPEDYGVSTNYKKEDDGREEEKVLQ